MILVPHGLRLMDLPGAAPPNLVSATVGLILNYISTRWVPLIWQWNCQCLKAPWPLSVAELQWSSNGTWHDISEVWPLGITMITMAYRWLLLDTMHSHSNSKTWNSSCGPKTIHDSSSFTFTIRLYTYSLIVIYFQFGNACNAEPPDQSTSAQSSPHWPRSMVQIQVSFHCGDSVCRTVASPAICSSCHWQNTEYPIPAPDKKSTNVKTKKSAQVHLHAFCLIDFDCGSVFLFWGRSAENSFKMQRTLLIKQLNVKSDDSYWLFKCRASPHIRCPLVTSGNCGTVVGICCPLATLAAVLKTDIAQKSKYNLVWRGGAGNFSRQVFHGKVQQSLLRSEETFSCGAKLPIKRKCYWYCTPIPQPSTIKLCEFGVDVRSDTTHLMKFFCLSSVPLDAVGTNILLATCAGPTGTIAAYYDP